MEELSDLVPKIITVRIPGARSHVEVRELAIDEILHVAQIAHPLFEAFFMSGGSINSIIREHIEPACALASVATGREEAWLRALPGGKFYEILRAATTANQDFFAQGLLLAESLTRLGHLLMTTSGASPTPEPSSESTAT